MNCGAAGKGGDECFEVLIISNSQSKVQICSQVAPEDGQDLWVGAWQDGKSCFSQILATAPRRRVDQELSHFVRLGKDTY